ncbi:MAG: translation initiation factor [Chloroflexota bacterium]|nr:translation initiation factor [Chloroflexota bacterium]
MIGAEGEQLGVVSTHEALQIARERGLDLVEVAPTAVPPVCRLLEYGRFKYEQEKKDRDARKNQKIVLMKEIRVRPKTDTHDLEVSAKRIEKFIEAGDRVKVTLRFRGREIAHPALGRQVLEELAERVKDIATYERMPLMEGNTMTMVLTKAKPATGAAREGAPGAPVPGAPPAPVGAPAPGAAAPAPSAQAAPAPRPAPAPGVTQAPVSAPVPAAANPAPAAGAAAAPAAAARPVPAPEAAPATGTAPAPAAGAAAPAPRPAAPAPPAPQRREA